MLVKFYLAWCLGLLAIFVVVASLGIKTPGFDFASGGSSGTSGFFGGHGSGGFGGSSGYGWGK
jgi:uncharacterized membrane protein YgcG